MLKGLFSQLTSEQQKAVLEYDGPVSSGPKEINKYTLLIDSLNIDGKGSIKCFGNSMLPILSNPSICYYKKLDEYQVGDIVFCKVRGRYIDAHKIIKKNKNKNKNKYLIANNHGWENGWTSTIYGKVVKSINPKTKEVKYF